MNILELIEKGESKTFEIKEKIPSSLSLAKTVVAFSNTAGGKLIIGVSDKREIIGIRDDRIFDIQEKVLSIIYDTCYPLILPEIYTVNVNDKILLVIEIYRGSLLPYYIKSKGKLKGTYIRVGSTNRLADENIILELERQRRGKTFDEEVNYEISMAEINIEPLFKEFNKISKNINISHLKNFKLIKNINGKDIPTNAFLVITGYFDNTGIKCARFKGKTMEIFLDKKEFKKDVFYNLENTILFLKNHLNLKAEINGLKREEEYEIPIIILREVILNAIVHRDYTRNSDIKIAIYDDVVEIVSPGGLPNGLTVEEVFNGRSELRNKIIARLFKELGYIETWGSGIKRINEICKREKIEFEFKEDGNFVTVIFHRKERVSKAEEDRRKTISADDYGRLRTITDDYERLSDEEKKVLLYLMDNKKITRKIAMDILQFKKTKVHQILSELKNKSFIEQHGKGKSTYYTLKKYGSKYKGQ